MKPRVLVVDDSLTVRMDLLEALEAAGLDAVGCGTIADARAALAKERFDLAILDVRLGDGDGVELLGEIRAQEGPAARTPVMMLSSEAEVKDRIRGLERGADEYAAKPYAVSWVIARARELTQRRAEDPRSVILVIDDSVSFREAMREALEAAGYRAVLAATGEDGLREAAAIRPALVICDGELPGIDGATVVRRLRLDAAHRHTPVIMISGSDIDAGEIGAFEAGVDAYLGKKTPPVEIVARVAALLGSNREAPVASVRSALATQKVLVVGKDLDATIAALRRDAFDVARAASAEDALLLLEHFVPACTVVEASVASCRAIRAAVRRPNAIVAVTADEDSTLAVECLGAGADEVVSRGTAGALLVARVRAQLRRKQAEEEATRERDARVSAALAEARAAHLAEVEKKNAELEVANEELEAFSYTVSHDLRAPLRAIQGFARALEEDEGDRLGEDGKGHLARIHGAAKRMNELIEDLLGLARVTRAEIVRREVDLGEIARAIVSDLRARSPERTAEVVIADGLVVQGDSGLLRAVLENLLGNAWKFTAKKTDGVRIEVGAIVRDGERAFFVADNGPGFDMAHAERLFRPFQRLHSPKEFEGTGIGLATVRRIVVRHGGRVWAESAPGEGAKFWLSLG
ncbi:MAG: response regulator [Labilithrix sp.]|nr:response regulator [Labilithrix sp.]MCW5815429.1 response regulator [Labilithrix sp.]